MSSVSDDDAAPNGLSTGPCAEVGDGSTSLRRLDGGPAVKLFVFHSVGALEGLSNDNDGVGGWEPSDTDGSEFFRFGRSCAIQEDRRAVGNGAPVGRVGGGATTSWSSSLEARTSLSGVGRRICALAFSKGEPPTVRLFLKGVEAILSRNLT